VTVSETILQAIEYFFSLFYAQLFICLAFCSIFLSPFFSKQLLPFEAKQTEKQRTCCYLAWLWFVTSRVLPVKCVRSVPLLTAGKPATPKTKCEHKPESVVSDNASGNLLTNFLWHSLTGTPCQVFSPTPKPSD